jgi:hypothetical protein
MLTTKAQEEAWRAQSAISPPGSQTAQFQVSEVEYINDKQGAHVLSTWRDVNNRGEKEEYEIIWILRHEPHGWGVAGMATKFLAGADPLILNFENHAEMLARRRWAEQEISRSTQQSATPQQAQRPDASQVR